VVFKNCLLFILISVLLFGQSECLASLESLRHIEQDEAAQVFWAWCGKARA